MRTEEKMETYVELDVELGEYGKCEIRQRLDNKFRHWTVNLFTRNASIKQVSEAVATVDGLVHAREVRDGLHALTFQGTPTVLTALCLLNSLAASLKLTCEQIKWTRAVFTSQ